MSTRDKGCLFLVSIEKSQNKVLHSIYSFDQSAEKYSWWSYRANSRARNVGWRIDYHMVSNALKDKIKNAYILPDIHHSDHCPVVVELM